MTTSTDLRQLATALAAAQAEMPTVPKRASGQVRGNTRYAYADLSDVWEIIRPVLAKHGLSVAQFPSSAGLVTWLLHSSGQWISEEFALPSTDSMQAAGSAITYARRYALCAVLGLVADEDDDGAGAGKRTRGVARAGAPAGSVSSPSSEGEPVEAGTARLLVPMAGSPPEPEEEEPARGPTPCTPNRHRELMATLSGLGFRTHDQRVKVIATVIGREVRSSKDLTLSEAVRVIEAGKHMELEYKP